MTNENRLNKNSKGSPEIKGYYNADTLSFDVASMVYRQSKAHIFNVLESQIDDQKRLFACKKIVENILDGIAKDARALVKYTLGDWKVEVDVDPESILTNDEESEARKEYNEDQKRFG